MESPNNGEMDQLGLSRPQMKFQFQEWDTSDLVVGQVAPKKPPNNPGYCQG